MLGVLEMTEGGERKREGRWRLRRRESEKEGGGSANSSRASSRWFMVKGRSDEEGSSRDGNWPCAERKIKS